MWTLHHRTPQGHTPPAANLAGARQTGGRGQVVTDLRVGDVIEVAERDYKYGTGRLMLRVSAIGETRRLADGTWLDVEGLELRPDGTQVSHRTRWAAVRVGAVRVRPETRKA